MNDLARIISAVADDADDFLKEATTRGEARAAIRDYLDENYPDLNDDEIARVISGLLTVLDDEGFFDDRGMREFIERDDDE